jgi:hypothetical protein
MGRCTRGCLWRGEERGSEDFQTGGGGVLLKGGNGLGVVAEKLFYKA